MYLDVAMDYILTMAEIKGISDGQNDLGYLFFIGASMQIVNGL